jgi:polysaccharide deacetylase 2 family uncharacterized protein YibQ
VKTKTPAEKPPKKSAVSPSRRSRGKKISFENGVKAALVAGVIICAAVLGMGAFFLLRPLFSPPIIPPAAGQELDLQAEPPSETTGPAAPSPEGVPDGGTVPGGGAELLPELEAAMEELAAGALSRQEPGPPPAASSPPQDRTGGSPPPGVIPPESKGLLIFVIDDAGNNLKELEGFLSFPGPLTIAVLPGLPYTAEAARRVRAAGKELFLHQPMEPLGGEDPGPGAVKTGMTPAEVKAVIEKNLAEVWPAAGFNNHEGSRVTRDPVIMKAVLETARDRRICFLDSRTIGDTAGPAVSKELAFPIALRDVFLDNEQDRESIIKYIEEGCGKAERQGYAVMIGHTWSPELAAVLTELYPALLRRGYRLSTVSAILDPGK